VSALGIPANDSIDGVAHVVGDLQLLVDLSIAAAVEHCLLRHFPHEPLLVLDVHCRTVFGAQTAVALPYAFIRGMLIIVKAGNIP
jgi:hypothetical protein